MENGCNITVFGTDEFTNGGHGGNHALNKYQAGLNASHGSFWSLWQNFYIGINACNAVISRGANVQGLSAQAINSGIAEARFLRAHYYFILVQHFGPIHLTLEETVGVETEAIRTPEAEIYKAIIDDLEFAIAHLPTVQSQFGRATKPAAMNMLGHVYLNRGYKDYAVAGDFGKAADLFMSVINDFNFVLLDDFMEVYNHDNERNAEIIWSVQYTTNLLINGDGNQLHLYFRPWYETFSNGLDRALGHGYGRPWIRYNPTPWLLENFRPLDVDSRFTRGWQDVWYFNTTRDIPPGAKLGDTAIWITDKYLNQDDYNAIKARLPYANIMTWNLDNRGASYYRPINMFPVAWKWEDNKRPDINHMAGSRDVIIYRLGETYLALAEALYKRDNSGTNAVQYVNAVRKRAAWPGKEAEMEVTADKIDIDFILDERSRELFGEQTRWLDLKRTGKLIERVKKYNPDEGKDNIQPFHILRPIPINQLTRMTNQWTQNPGY